MTLKEATMTSTMTKLVTTRTTTEPTRVTNRPSSARRRATRRATRPRATITNSIGTNTTKCTSSMMMPTKKGTMRSTGLGTRITTAMKETTRRAGGINPVTRSTKTARRALSTKATLTATTTASPPKKAMKNTTNTTKTTAKMAEKTQERNTDSSMRTNINLFCC